MSYNSDQLKLQHLSEANVILVLRYVKLSVIIPRYDIKKSSKSVI